MDKFYFGTATSAHQIEGNNLHSDWWEFEKKILSKQGITSNQAINHYKLFDEDFSLAEQLGHNAYRFSLEWAKIEPLEGQIDHTVIQHYQKVFASLKKHKLKPFVTLFHFSLPLWFAQKGGFEKKNNLSHFINYTKYIAKEFQDDLEYIFTINEPEVYCYHSYLIGKWPPQKKSYFMYKKVLKNLISVHQKIYQELKKLKPEIKIGIAKNNIIFNPDRKNNILDIILANILKKEWNYYFTDKTKQQLDFIGLNYYFTRYVRADLHLRKQFYHYYHHGGRKTDLNWEVNPKGIYILTKALEQRYQKPVIISENGVADHKDSLRKKVLAETLKWLFKAKKEGVQLFGYLHWSLLDNYEWDSGFKPKFGLIAINYKDLSRSIRPSALLYQKLIQYYQKEKL